MAPTMNAGSGGPLVNSRPAPTTTTTNKTISATADDADENA